ncbi:hypothetical protein C1I60_06120 [Paenibacillus terrae]|uniref:Uncharacterized protein n=1 Tax=Paenibacillus terrae TaxID=159743 RepID=A0A4U2Q1J5_9BACL|nr:hypothetical protein [Paenibacillus terrae]TKH46003.1 hypothetical protein C1I60_06120 [Paenibacillus terrae]
MYKSSDIKGYNPALLPHQLYFIQRWGELFEKSPLHYRKLSYPCVRAVLKEAIQVVEHYRAEVLYEHNVFEIFQEVVITLKENKVLSASFKEDWSLVSSRLEMFSSDKESFLKTGNTVEKYRKLELPLTLIRGLLNKLENTDIPRLYIELLSKELSKSKLSFEHVDEYLELLMSELLFEGHHKQYLYRWGHGVLVNDDENSFLKRLERISELGVKNRREFECFIRLKLPDGYDGLIGTNGPLTFFSDPDRARIQIDEEHDAPQVHKDAPIIEFFKKDKHIARMKLFATDDVAAINIARDELISTTRLFTLENRHKLYNPGNLTEALVFDVNSKKIYTEPVIEISQHGLQVTKNDKYIKINMSSKLTGKYKGLDQLLQWCRVIQDSPKETGLVAMWSLMEYLFVTDPTNKRKSIIEYTTPYLTQFYLKSLVFRCRELIKQNQAGNEALIAAVREKLGKDSIDRKTNEIKLHYLLQFIAEYKEETLSLFSGDALNQRYIGLLNKYMQLRGKKLWFFEYLEHLERQIDCDLSRAYRLRNILTHQAYVDKIFFEEIYERLSFYLKLILDDLLYSMSLQPDNSFHQLVRIKKESYKDYQKLIAGISKIDSFKALLQTKSLLV